MFANPAPPSIAVRMKNMTQKQAIDAIQKYTYQTRIEEDYKTKIRDARIHRRYYWYKERELK